MFSVDNCALRPDSSPFGTVSRPFTAADVAALPENLPSGQVHYELERGRLAVLPPRDFRHGGVQATLGALLFEEGPRRGHACIGVGVVIARNPDTIYCPDVAFFAAERLPVRDSEEGFCETIPNFVAEVRSKIDALAELSRKAKTYLAAGVRTVWIVDEASRTITIEEPDTAPKVVGGDEPIPAPAAIPELDLTVARVFD